MRAHLSRQSTRKPNDGTLGCNVVSQVIQTSEKGNRRNIYHRSGTQLHHVRHDQLRAMEDALQVDVVHAVPLLFCHFQEGLPRIDTGVVNQNVDSSKALDRILNNRRHGIAVPGSGLKAERGAAVLLQSRCDFLDMTVEVGEKYMGSALGK